MPRPTRGPGIPLTRTGLSPSVARRSRRFRFESPGHWPDPRSLAATCGVACCCPFLRLLRCFSSPGSPRRAMDSLDDTAYAVGCPIRRPEDHRALAPPLGFSQRATSFIASRCQGIHQMPFMCCARAQPQARGEAACRGQRSEVGCQKASSPATRPTLCFSDLRSPISDLRDHCAGTAPADARASAYAYPCPGPTNSRDCGRRPDLLHGHDSLHDVIRSEVGGQRSDAIRHTPPPVPGRPPTPFR